MNLTPPLNFISASRSPCRAFAYAAAKSSNLRTTSLCCQLPLFFFFNFFFHGIFSAVRTPSLPPAPTGASGEGVFQGEGEFSSQGEAVPGKSAALCLWSSCCPMTGKTERKVIPVLEKLGQSPAHKPQPSDRKR